MIIALDVATKCGIAILDENKLSIYYIEGSPIFQLNEIESVTVGKNPVFLLEDFSYFNARNPKTTAQFNQRLGYLYYSLLAKYPTYKYNVNTVRKHLGITGRMEGVQKKAVCQAVRMKTSLRLTTDETDAVALILFHLKIGFENLQDFQSSKLKRKKEG